MSDITSQSLTSIVKNIKEKKLSSEDVTKAFVERSEKSKELNAYITEDYSSALEKAKKFDFVVIDGVRNPQESAAIKNDLNGKIVHISAYKNRRLERYLERAEIRGEGSATATKFQKSEARDLGAGEDENGQQVAECLALADFKLINNSTVEQFYDNCQTMLDGLLI